MIHFLTAPPTGDAGTGGASRPAVGGFAALLAAAGAPASGTPDAEGGPAAAAADGVPVDGDEPTDAAVPRAVTATLLSVGRTTRPTGEVGRTEGGVATVPTDDAAVGEGAGPLATDMRVPTDVGPVATHAPTDGPADAPSEGPIHAPMPAPAETVDGAQPPPGEMPVAVGDDVAATTRPDATRPRADTTQLPASPTDTSSTTESSGAAVPDVAPAEPQVPADAAVPVSDGLALAHAATTAIPHASATGRPNPKGTSGSPARPPAPVAETGAVRPSSLGPATSVAAATAPDLAPTVASSPVTTGASSTGANVAPAASIAGSANGPAPGEEPALVPPAVAPTPAAADAAAAVHVGPTVAASTASPQIAVTGDGATGASGRATDAPMSTPPATDVAAATAPDEASMSGPVTADPAGRDGGPTSDVASEVAATPPNAEPTTAPARDVTGAGATATVTGLERSAATPAAPTTAAEVERSQLALQRVMDAVDRLRNAPPPRTMGIELTDQGIRLSVELRGRDVLVTVHGDQAFGGLARDLQTALDQRGFRLGDLRHGGRDPEGRGEGNGDRGATSRERDDQRGAAARRPAERRDDDGALRM